MHDAELPIARRRTLLFSHRSTLAPGPASVATRSRWWQTTCGPAFEHDSPGALSNPWQFAGEHLDTETSLYKIGERNYNPALARWTPKDPLMQAFSPREANGYAYAATDPVNVTDPSGEAVWAPMALAAVRAAPYAARAASSLRGAQVAARGAATSLANTARGAATSLSNAAWRGYAAAQTRAGQVLARLPDDLTDVGRPQLKTSSVVQDCNEHLPNMWMCGFSGGWI